MKILPLPAKIYIWLIIALGAAALVLFGWHFYKQDLLGAHADTYLSFLLLGCLAAFGASFLKVKVWVYNKAQRDKHGNISLGFVPTFFLLFGLGPFAAIVASIINMAVMTCFPRRSPYYQVLFSIGAVTISVAAAGGILWLFGLTPEYWLNISFDNNRETFVKTVGIAAATMAYSLLNTSLIAVAIGLTSRKIHSVFGNRIICG